MVQNMFFSLLCLLLTHPLSVCLAGPCALGWDSIYTFWTCSPCFLLHQEDVTPSPATYQIRGGFLGSSLKVKVRPDLSGHSSGADLFWFERVE